MTGNKRYGLVRLGTASTRTRVGHVSYNVSEHLKLFEQAESEQIDLLLCPELGTSGYSCNVLFQQDALQEAVLKGLAQLRQATATSFHGVAVVGAPLAIDNALMNCAVVLANGKYLGVVPKSYIPNYKEFVEEKWFASALDLRSTFITLEGEPFPIGSDLLFEANGFDKFLLGVEICEDAWVPISPGDIMSAYGATIIGNISASDELVGKADYRRNLFIGKSGAAICAYGYTSAGPTESTTDLVFGGHCIIAENGTLMKESQRFVRAGQLTFADVDVERIMHDRQLSNSYQDNFRGAGITKQFRRVVFDMRPATRNALTCRRNGSEVARFIDATPFVPNDPSQLHLRCEDIFNIQVNGLASRLESVGLKNVVIGVSGGLDSTHALTVTCKCFDLLGLSRKNIQAYTLPGFGTGERSRNNAMHVMEALDVTIHTADIRELCLLEMQATGYRPFGINLTSLNVETFTQALQKLPADAKDLRFENVQARMRTLILMNAGFVIGTGDLSELALGWCTFNADHMSMYNVNASVPKTLIKFLVKWTADHHFEGPAHRTMIDIFQADISPELLPVGADGKTTQRTEDTVGPYELNDFFLYYLGRFGMTPEKIFYLAKHARFTGDYSELDLLKWLEHFLIRFFGQQYKRSSMPDGPKVGTITLSPRAEWLMPSDASADSWLEWVRAAQKHYST
jgi:NAD+ synthase (glutamine-hydrolysing)